MSKRYYSAKTDANQSDIVQALRDVGAHVELMHRIANLFDILVGFRGQLYIMEIKRDDLSPSKTKLTSGELQCKENFERVGVPYNVVKTVDEALYLIGAIDSDGVFVDGCWRNL